MSQQLEVVVLAAGQGTRMRSDLPKVLHPLAGRPLLAHVLETATALKPRAVHVVYGHGGERVREALPEWPVGWVEQAEQLGTGHALAQAQPHVAAGAAVLVLYGDVPLITPATVTPLIELAHSGSVGLLTAMLEDPSGYGRIVRDADGQVARIVEQKDATERELALREVNTGIMALPAGRLAGWLEQLSNDNAQCEYYLTDVIAMARADGVGVAAVVADDIEQTLGVNDRQQLAHLERAYQRRQAERLMRAGVTLADPARFDLRGTIEVGRDVILDANVILEGDVRLGDRVRVGANCILRDVEVEADAVIEPMSVLEQARVGQGCKVGPFARLRPGSELESGAKIGNFVEVKKSVIGAGSKVNHLSYIGDTTMGADVNIGAGTITCNYDGANKHRTVIGDRVFIGSDTQLVAPVAVGDGATIGAGSTVTKDAPAEALTLSRTKQQTIPGWQRPRKEKR